MIMQWMASSGTKTTEGAMRMSYHTVDAFCRYNMYGDISMRAAEEMRKKEV